MGDFWYIVGKKLELKSVVWKSLNYVLYGDMSCCMFDVLLSMVLCVELYFIDEMFMDFFGLLGDCVECSVFIRVVVCQIVKILICVGIGFIKMIVKLVNKLVKVDCSGVGVFDLLMEEVW